MPLTDKGKEIMGSMGEQYGEKKGEQVFYASRNAGKIEGVDVGKEGLGARTKESLEADPAIKVVKGGKGMVGEGLEAEGAKDCDSAGAEAKDGVLNWAAGEHHQSPTIDPSLSGEKSLDPAGIPKGVTGVDDWDDEAQVRHIEGRGRTKLDQGPLTKAQAHHASEVSERWETLHGKPLPERQQRRVAISQHPQNDVEPNTKTTDSGEYGRSMSQFHRK